MNMFKLLVICGGPSFERDISLNSARSVCDNVARDGVDLKIIFVDKTRGKHVISPDLLYSNTTSDFDFKLASLGAKLTEADFEKELKSADLVFPVLHGVFGEDGELAQLLEKLQVPFVGSGSAACQRMYNKERADYDLLKANGFWTIPKLYIRKEDDDAEQKIRRFFNVYSLDEAVMKPIEGGSSVGVMWAESADMAVKEVQQHITTYGEVVIEPVCKGREFTVIILQNDKGQPIALMPTEIDILPGKDDTDGKIFNKRRKYLATSETHYYCPPRFTADQIKQIRTQAAELFSIAGAEDFLRIDGWVMDDGMIYFSDFNPISGMEQNSFIFQQASRVGLSHADMLEYILESAARRQKLAFPKQAKQTARRQKMYVVMGGWTSERQVSLMSGTNVWLKLRRSDIYDPVPYLLFEEDGQPFVFELPYSMALNHTTEEMLHQYQHASRDLGWVKDIRSQLRLSMDDACTMIAGEKLTLDEFIAKVKNDGAQVFIGLHGGFGEGGDFQAKLEEAGVHFNGSGSAASALCMDKYKTGEAVDKIGGILRTAEKKLVSVDDKPKYEGKKVIAKPNDDGCSTGVVILDSQETIDRYVELLKVALEDERNITVPAGTFYMQSEKITMSPRENFLIEEYIQVDDIEIRDKKLNYKPTTGWVELTVGVLEKDGVYRSLLPSISVAENGVLSLEEKFQGGTGVNITPPPPEIMNEEFIAMIQHGAEAVAKAVGVADYCRIDIFANQAQNEIVVIEVNTLPGLSPSTVLFQQGAADGKTPRQLLEIIA
jgi:D-alanine--D-alanine ligase